MEQDMNFVLERFLNVLRGWQVSNSSTLKSTAARSCTVDRACAGRQCFHGVLTVTVEKILL